MNSETKTPRNHPVVREYSRLAGLYDEKWSFYVRATLDATLARLSLAPGELLLDVGCGTGVLLHRLAAGHPAGRLAGIDPVPEMLAIARNRLPDEVELREAWIERLPHPDKTFDVVVSCNMFHYIREPVAALREVLRVLRPGGRLVLTDWCDDYLACRLCDLWLRLFNRAHFHTYGVRPCQRMLGKAGFEVSPIERYKINWLWGLMTATARRPGLPT